MTMPPFFTVGIPTFNRAALLKEALDSTLSQTFSDFEILVGDNASTDNTPEVFKNYSDARIRVIRQKENIGAVNNFNALIKESAGRFFVLHQDDDLLHPEFLKRCYEAVLNRDDVTLYGAAAIQGTSPKGIVDFNYSLWHSPPVPMDFFRGETVEFSGAQTAAMLLFGIPFLHPGVAMRREALVAIGGYFDKFALASDNVTLARVALRGRSMYDTRIGAFRRAHGGNTCKAIDPVAQRRSFREACRLIIADLDQQQPTWQDDLLKMLKNLSRRRKWKLLTNACEVWCPPVMRKLLCESISPRHPQLANLRAFACKADFRMVLRK